MQHSKRFRAAATAIDAEKTYPIDQALDMLLAVPKTKFDETVELHLSLGIDIKKSDQTVRGFVQLPHGTGKKLRIAVFCEEAKQKEATEAGATLVGGDELIEKIAQNSSLDFDVAIAEPAMMKKMAKIAKVLGQKGLMPNPKTGTVTDNIGKAVQELSGGKVNFRNDDGGNVHQIVGKLSWDKAKLKENLVAALQAIKAAKPEGVKGVYIKKVVLTSTMGPGIAIETA